jgi:hypothetical protein
MRKLLMGLAALSSLALVGVATSPSALARVKTDGKSAATAKAHPANGSNSDPTIYDSTVEPFPGNLASEAFEATQTSEFGNQVTFAGSARVLDNVVVQMSSWGCGSGNWTNNTCTTNDVTGTTFNEPITLNIYNVGADNAVGSLIATETPTFAIPYRPSADPNYATDCASTASANDEDISAFAGAWYDAALNSCFHGYLTPITFNFGHVVLPNNVIYGIAYNTSDYGFTPYGDGTACHATTEGCGYDSLNVGLSEEPTAPSVGSDPNLGTVYEDTLYAPFYCDNGAGGTGTFRIDGQADSENCASGDGGWSVNYPPTGPNDSPYYIPAVQFNAVTSPAATITSADSASVVAGSAFSFTVDTTGVPVPVITEKGKLPKGLSFVNNGDGTATISGTAKTSDKDKSYVVHLKATNSSGKSKQLFTLSLTGGKP